MYTYKTCLDGMISPRYRPSMAVRPVPSHPSSGEGVRGRRVLVARAPTTPEEQAFFNRLKDAVMAPTMADLIRYAVAKVALERGVEIPEKWQPYYEGEEPC